MNEIFLSNDRIKGILVSFFAHAAIFICGGFALARPAEYAIELGTGGIEVSLTAAPAEPILAPKPAIQESKNPEGDLLMQYQVEEKKQVQTAARSEHKGDGSSAVPGKDVTTFYSAGGAITEAKPNYLRNPAPPYPYEARKNGWGGVVVLKVLVDKAGYPVQVEKDRSSGYDVLDQSAVKTVRKWRFQPARLGALPVESSVLVPIRFQLEGAK